MARQTGSPYGTTKRGFVWDTSLREYINTRTGEIVSAADAIPVPPATKQRFRSGAVAIKYKPTKRADFPKRFHGDQALDVIRRQASRAPRDAIIVVRGAGGTDDYEEEWWSSVPTDVEDLLDMDDEELADFLYGINDDGPEELDIYIREEE